MENSATENGIWLYERNGEKKGRVAETDIFALIKNGTLRHGSSARKKGFSDWTNIEGTQLREHFDDTMPPPLTGAKANNTIVWILAFAPLIGLSFLDEKKLKKASMETSMFGGWVWLVPVYLYQRSLALKQNLAYFIVWIFCFILVEAGMT